MEADGSQIVCTDECHVRRKFCKNGDKSANLPVPPNDFSGIVLAQIIVCWQDRITSVSAFGQWSLDEEVL